MKIDIDKYKTLEKENKQLKKDNKQLFKIAKFRNDERNKFQELQRIETRLSKLYFLGGGTLFLCIAVFGLMFVTKVSVILMVVLGIISIPLILGSFTISIIQLYRDRNKVKSFLIKKMAKKFIIANFYTDDKKLLRIAFLLGGNEFKWNGGVYLVDNNCIWYDLDKNPNLFYKENLPNPIIFNFMTNINKYNASTDKTNVFDNMGNLLDLSYSSETLQEFKKDKMFLELHKAGGLESIGLTLGVFIVMAILLVLSWVLK